MKLKNILKWLLIATSIMMLTACGGSSRSVSDYTGSTPDGDITIVPPPAPVYPSASSLTINLKDATDSSGIVGASVKIEGTIINTTSASATTDAEGKVTFNLDQSQLADLNKDGIADEAKEVTILISGDSILSRSMTMLVTNYGENSKDVQIVNLAGVAPEGIVIVSEAVDLNTAPDAIINDIPVMIVEAQSSALTATAVPTVAIPLASTFISSTGVELDTSTLTVEIVAFDVNSENASDLLAVGMSYEIENPSRLAEDLGVEAGEAQNVAIALMGVISVNIVDAGGNEAIGLVSIHPVVLTIPIAANMINPETGNLVVAGDTVALLSLSENTNAWSYEGEHIVATDASGNLIIRYETTHFSGFAIGNVKPAQCTGSINIITQYNQPYSDIGSFRLQGTYINVDSTYNGEGRLDYTDLTDEPLKIIFTPIGGSAVILSEGTTVTGTIETDSSIIYDVSPCDAAGKTIVFEALAAPVPKIYIDKYYSSSRSGRSITEGEGSAFTVTLEDPPVGQAVSFSLRSNNDNIGDDLSIAEQKYTFAAGVTSLNIPYSAIDDTLVEGTESFTIEFYDADNSAVFVTYNEATNSNFLSTISIIDNDRLLVNDINYTASEEDKNATITFTLDQVVPDIFTQGVTMFVRAYPNNPESATEMLDFDSKTYLSSTYTGSRYYRVEFAKGSDVATLNIPLYDDTDVDPDETFLIDMFSSVVDFNNSSTQEIIITDNDTMLESNATAYSVEFIRSAYPDSRLGENSMWEGEVSRLKVTLDKAAKEPIKITYDPLGNSNYTLSGNGELLFDRRDATKYIDITSSNNDITGPDFNITVNLDANTTITGPADINVTIKDDDFDYIYIDGSPSGELSIEEGYAIQPYFYVYSNYSDLMIDYLTDGNSQSVSGTLLYTQGGNSFLIAEPLVDVDDEIVNAPRTYTATSTLSDDPINTLSTNFVVSIYGSTGGYRCSNLYNPDSATFNACNIFEQTISVLDDDSYSFAIEEPGSIQMELIEGSTETEPKSITLIMASEGLEGSDRDISFDLQGGEILTLTEAEPRKEFVVNIPAIPIDSSLVVGATGNEQFTVDLTFTPETQAELQAANLDYKLDTIVVIDVNYTIIEAPTSVIPTGSEGGN